MIVLINWPEALTEQHGDTPAAGSANPVLPAPPPAAMPAGALVLARPRGRLGSKSCLRSAWASRSTPGSSASSHRHSQCVGPLYHRAGASRQGVHVHLRAAAWAETSMSRWQASLTAWSPTSGPLRT